MQVTHAAVAPQVPAAPGEKATILIVDDTPANIAALVAALGTDYRTKAALNGETALQLAATTPPDLILLDVQMPGLSGYEVCRRLKQDPATQGIPVVFVTAMHEVEDVTRGLELGGVDYVTRPVSPAIVRARVRTHLSILTQARALQGMVAQLAAQSAALRELNHTLELRVEEGVAQVERFSRLKRFFSPSVVDLLLRGTHEDPLASHRREIAAAFLDLRGFTAFTEASDPEDVIGVIREYHECMGALIMAHGGTVERFAGDGIMIFFNDPVEVENPAALAVRMSVEMQRAFGTLAEGWRRRGYDLAMGIGIAQGYATIGAIGFEGRRDYGAIGTVTNLAARLCGEAHGGQILVTQRVRTATEGLAEMAFVGDLELKGFRRPTATFEVLRLHEGPSLVDMVLAD